MSDKKTVDETGKKMHEIVHFEHNGVTYQARKKLHPRVLDFLQRDKSMLALELMIGPESYGKFLDSVDDVDEVNEMFKAFNKAADSGNS